MTIELHDPPRGLRGAAPPPAAVPLPPGLLAAIAAGWATATDLDSVPEPGAALRTFRRLLETDRYDVWLIRWGPGSGAPLHDHAGSAGALHVVDGVLTEERSEGDLTVGLARFTRDRGKTFGIGHVHEVRNDSAETAASVHVYSPPLRAMTYYARTSGPVPLPLYQAFVTPVFP